ncbi:MAG: hypothetical protein JJU11_18540 [Candidatus Sumerlaeia bacterium]|nr:hypothetical protein [Candidatus Sumerlaeia bacterium]
MADWQILGVLATVLGIGMLRQIKYSQKSFGDLEFAHDYLCKLQNIIRREGQYSEDLMWLHQNSDSAQRLLGYKGIMDVRLPANMGIQHNVPIILNGLAEIERAHTGSVAVMARFYAQYVQNALLRYIGEQKILVDKERLRQFNPIVWLGKGVGLLLEIPFALLVEAGAMTRLQKDRITSSWLFALFSGVSALVAVIGSIMGIVMGWEDFVTTLTGWWS